MSGNSLLKLTQRGTTPPDKFRFTFREDGYRISHFSYDGWLAEIKKHAKDNGYDSPENWVALAEDQLCQLLPSGWCKYEDGRPADARVDARMRYEDILNGTKVLIEFVKQGAPLVSQDLAESRARTCGSCYFNIQAGGCGTCLALANVVEEVATNKSTKADAQLALKSCAVCKCLSRAHIWLPADVLVRGVTPEMMGTFPADFCWKRLEIEALTLLHSA